MTVKGCSERGEPDLVRAKVLQGPRENVCSWMRGQQWRRVRHEPAAE